MSRIAARLHELGLTLPKPMATTGLPFVLVRVVGDRAYVAGHVPTDADGRVTTTIGKVGGFVTLADGQAAARLCALGMFASLHSALGDLDRITHWLKLFGMVNVAPGFRQIPQVINGASALIIEVFGKDIGAHSRSAVGMAELPFGVPVEIEAEVAIR